MTTTSPAPEEETSPAGFDYCFWSKLLVAIVLFPLLAFIAASFFTNIVVKLLAVAFAIGGIVYAAIWLDRVPCLAGKIPALIGRNAKRP